MRIIERNETENWVAGKLGKSFGWRAVRDEYPFAVDFSLPIDSGKKTAIVRSVTATLEVNDIGLLWISDFSIFPSAENLALFRGFRKSLGENRELADAPGHLFTSADLTDVECLLDLALYFFWDVSVVDSTTWFAFSHDEYFSVNARDSDRLKRVSAELRLLDLKTLSPKRPITTR